MSVAEFLEGSSVWGALCGVFPLSAVCGVFLRREVVRVFFFVCGVVWGRVCECLRTFCVAYFVCGVIFMVCGLCGVLRVGDSSSSILYGTWVWGEGFPVRALCFFFLFDFF